MEIKSIKHKALLRFAESGRSKGLMEPARIARMLSYLASIESIDELTIPPNFGAHPLTGGRAGEWSLTVTKNWRMTFRINDRNAIEDLDLEDYH